MKRASLFLYAVGMIAIANKGLAKQCDVGERWTIDVPEDWKVVESSEGPMKIFNFGPGPFEPLTSVPAFLVDPETMRGVGPAASSGLAIGVSNKPLAAVVIQGSQVIQKRFGKVVFSGYKKEFTANAKKLIINVFIMSVRSLPGSVEDKDLPMVVQAVGASPEEVNQVLTILGTIKSKGVLSVRNGERKAAKESNQSMKPTVTSVTSPAAQEPRQP